MSYLIDSDVVVDVMFAQAEAVRMLAQLRRSGIAVSVTSSMEIVEGIAGGAAPRRAGQGTRAFMRGARLLVVSRAVADRAAAIRLDLRHQKRQVNERALDILIAATALDHGPTLVTRNTRDSQDIGGLRLRDSP